jgi:hypothetical protein
MLHLDPARATADAHPTEPSAVDQRRDARAQVERQMAMLDRLAEIGMEIAEEAGRQARAPATDRPLVDPGLTYARAARAVRLTIALQQRLAKDLAGLGRAEADARRTRIHRLVERAIEGECDDADGIEQLCDDARESLREYEDLDDFADRPLGEIVALICKDLGLSTDAWAGEFALEDLPPLGEVPDPVGGRGPSSPVPQRAGEVRPKAGMGAWGAMARDSALQPPSSAAQTLPPEGEELIAFDTG